MLSCELSCESVGVRIWEYCDDELLVAYDDLHIDALNLLAIC